MHGERTEADRVLRRATTRFGVLNVRVPGAPVTPAVVWKAAETAMARSRRELDKGATSGADHEHACRKLAATARLLARGDAQKWEIDGRGKRERPVHVLDVDVDVMRIKAALEGAGDTQEARTCARQVKVMLRSAGEVAPGVARHRVEYVHSELGRDLREAGHVTGGRLYARGVDPFKWAKAFRRAAMHGAWEADDSACFATARQAMAGKRGGMAEHFLRHRRDLLVGR